MKPSQTTGERTPLRVQRFQWGVEPGSLSELALRAEHLAGVTLETLAAERGQTCPPDLRRAKGWVGSLVEAALGAQSGSRAQPDFEHLGVELKTLPIDALGKPLESTFVCTIELASIADSEWESSRLFHKLSHVLFVPVEGTRSIPVAKRRIATPFFWKPNEAQHQALRKDWETLCLLIAQGRTSEITGHLGEVLQVRPKAARGSSRRRAQDETGALYDEQPKGFYLRALFTHGLVQQALKLPPHR